MCASLFPGARLLIWEMNTGLQVDTNSQILTGNENCIISNIRMKKKIPYFVIKMTVKNPIIFSWLHVHKSRPFGMGRFGTGLF